MNQASRLSCVVPVLPATLRPGSAAARPVPSRTTAPIIRTIIAARSGSTTALVAGGATGWRSWSMIAVSMPYGVTRRPPLKNVA